MKPDLANDTISPGKRLYRFSAKLHATNDVGISR